MIRISQLVQARRPAAWAIALLLLSAFLLANLWWSRPYFNWDLIGYVGAAHSFTSSNPDSIHRATFADIKQSVPADSYSALTSATGYRSAIADDPEKFAQQLPFYVSKPIYPALMLLGSQFGFSLTVGSTVVSQVAFCLIALLVFVWLSRHYAPLLAFVAGSLVVSMPFVLDLARYSTPDALSTLVVLLACFLFTEAKRPRLAASVLVLSVLVRPDNALLAITFPLVMWGHRQVALGPCLAAAGATLLLAFLISAYSGSYGWQILLHHGFIDRLEDPRTAVVDIGVIDYLIVLARGSHPVSMRGLSYSLTLFLVLSFVALRFAGTGKRAGVARYQMLVAMLAFVAGRWLVFPGEAERTLVPFYVLVLLVLLIEAQQDHTPNATRYRRAEEV